MTLNIMSDTEFDNSSIDMSRFDSRIVNLLPHVKFDIGFDNLDRVE